MSEAMRGVFRDMVEWERACGRPLPTEGPRVPGPNTVRLCQALIAEEVMRELLPALADKSLPDIADAAIDSIWVILETLYFCGINPAPIWDAVREANMAKHGPGSWKRDDGKIMKPPGWANPDIAAILAAQRPLAETYGDQA